MKDLKLYIDSGKNYHLVSEETINCNKCHLILDKIFFILINWGKKKSDLNVVCKDCVIKTEKTGVVYEARYGIISESVEPDFCPIFLTPPDISNSKNNISVFEAAELKSDKTIDKAFRSREFPSLEGSSIGKSVEELENNSTSESEMLDYLDKDLLEDKTKTMEVK